MRFSKRPPRRGLTLIEVLAGTVLLTAMMATYLKGAKDLRVQKARATAIIECTAELEALLEQWFSEGKGIPRPAEGTMAWNERFRWRTKAVPCQATKEPLFETVRLEVFEIPSSADPGPALFALEVVDFNETEELSETKAP